MYRFVSRGAQGRVALSLSLLAALATLPAGCSSTSAPPRVLQLIAVTPASPSLAPGATQQLTATGKYSDGSTADLTSTVTWTSLDPAITTVATGLVTAATATGGTATITATLDEQVGFTRLSVTGARLTAIRLVPAGTTIAASVTVPVGVTARLLALGLYTDGAERDVTGIAAWTAADPSIAGVAAGAITGVLAGSTTVGAALGDCTAAAAVTVSDATLSSIEVSPRSAPVLATGEIEGFSAFGIFNDGRAYDMTDVVTWASSDTAVASISNEAGTRGQATGLAAGPTNVTATLGAVTSAAVALTVADGAVNYAETRLPFTFTDAIDGTVVVSADDQEQALPVVDGLTFTLFGTSYTTDQIVASTNGDLAIGGAAVTPYDQDLITTVRMQVRGEAPTRELVVQWDGIDYARYEEPVKFQVVLHEGTNLVDFIYVEVSSDQGLAATVRMANPGATAVTTHSAANRALFPGLALRFTP